MKSLISSTLFFLIILTASAHDFPEISLEDFRKERLKSRESAIYAVLELPPADQRHICRTLLYTEFGDYLDLIKPENKDEPIILYGRGDGDDLAVEAVAKEIVKKGYPNVKIFYGGIRAWLEAGEKLPK